MSSKESYAMAKDYYYPDRIAEDDTSSFGSAEVVLHPMRHKVQSTTGACADGCITSVGRIDDDDNDDSLFASSNGRHHDDGTGKSLEEKYAPRSSRSEDLNTIHTAALIKNERHRRLGVREHADADNGQAPLPLSSSSESPAISNPVGVLGNIRGWFGGGGSAVASDSQSTQAKKPPTTFRQSSATVSRTQSNITSSHLRQGASLQEHRGNNFPPAISLQNARKELSSDDSSSSTSSDETYNDDDDFSSSQSSNASDPKHRNASLTPQERARARALRYLSDSCVDAGRKAKTSSYVRGLERLDLKRRRDRYEKELEIFEAEMNKDRWLINNGEERDVILAMAAALSWEVPRQANADAGSGSGLGEDVTGSESFMTYEEYADAINVNGPILSCGFDRQPSLWENKGAVDVYMSSLQCRLQNAQERTRSLEKRLVVLEQAGDDIISSLCEDLAEVTGHSNKVEAQYVKKGKELHRKQRRGELMHRSRINQAEVRVRKLKERLMVVSGDQTLTDQTIDATMSVASDENSTSSGNDDENDEVLLEKKLSAIKAKNDQDKNQHELEVDSLRRQCEQLKLRLSVARLVMEGDDNLQEYMALLERQRKNITSDNFEDGVPIPPPPLHIARARAKLLKVAHLECVYVQRLSLSKAFTDATINALDQELMERESASQKMEVRCLNELFMFDLGVKDAAKEASDKLSQLESEAHELDGAILTQIQIAGDLFAARNTVIDPLKCEKEDAIRVNDETYSDMLKDGKNDLRRLELGELKSIDFDSPPDNGIADEESAILKPEMSLPVCKRDYDDERVENYLISDVDTLKTEYEIAVEMSLPPDACHNSCDSIVKYSHTAHSADVCLEFDTMKDDTGEKSSVDLSDHEIVGGIPSPPLNGEKSSRMQAFMELMERNIVDGEVSTFEVSPDDTIDVKVYPDHKDVQFDEKGERSSAVDSQKEAVLQSLGRELNCTLAEYQTSYDLSTSGDRVEQLNYMNDLVVAIAKWAEDRAHE
ncbi:LOW QUALITY PROTEIN: hypothetical protein ACHAW5_009205 [Stephanodiscus triporus]|uniref:Fibrous sheath-interacting protein 1 n=1 Tax=Stephanodiscus triporus TaxID=2934178 RepID=A0ABD3PLG4_9STRA